MIRRDGRRMVLSGPVTLANVAEVLLEGRRHLDEGRRRLDEGVRVVDLGEVTEMDSALLALLLAWLRDAVARLPGWLGEQILHDPQWAAAELHRNPQWINEELLRRVREPDLFGAPPRDASMR